MVGVAVTVSTEDHLTGGVGLDQPPESKPRLLHQIWGAAKFEQNRPMPMRFGAQKHVGLWDHG